MLNFTIFACIFVLMIAVCLLPRTGKLTRIGRSRAYQAAEPLPEGATVSIIEAASLLGLAYVGPGLQGLLIQAGVRAEFDPDGYLRFDARDIIALESGKLPLPAYSQPS